MNGNVIQSAQDTFLWLWWRWIVLIIELQFITYNSINYYWIKYNSLFTYNPYSFQIFILRIINLHILSIFHLFSTFFLLLWSFFNLLLSLSSLLKHKSTLLFFFHSFVVNLKNYCFMVFRHCRHSWGFVIHQLILAVLFFTEHRTLFFFSLLFVVFITRNILWTICHIFSISFFWYWYIIHNCIII